MYLGNARIADRSITYISHVYILRIYIRRPNPMFGVTWSGILPFGMAVTRDSLGWRILKVVFVSFGCMAC